MMKRAGGSIPGLHGEYCNSVFLFALWTDSKTHRYTVQRSLVQCRNMLGITSPQPRESAGSIRLYFLREAKHIDSYAGSKDRNIRLSPQCVAVACAYAAGCGIQELGSSTAKCTATYQDNLHFPIMPAIPSGCCCPFWSTETRWTFEPA